MGSYEAYLLRVIKERGRTNPIFCACASGPGIGFTGPESIKRGSFHSSSGLSNPAVLPVRPQRALLPILSLLLGTDIPQSHHVINTTREEARQSSDGCLCVAWRGVVLNRAQTALNTAACLAQPLTLLEWSPARDVTSR